MNSRKTSPAKWSDEWFLSLTPIQKLIFTFLCENCDDSGFIEIHIPTLSVKIGVLPHVIQEALKGMGKCYLKSKLDYKKLYIINFLKHQEKLPLSLKHKEDLFIIEKLKEAYNKKGFEYPEIMDILNDVSKSHKRDVPFIIPELDEFIAYSAKRGKSEEWAISLFKYYQQVNWVVGKSKKKMVSWESAIDYCIRREKQSKNLKTENADSRFSNLSQIREEIIGSKI